MPKEKIELLVEGGKATAAPPIGPALSPLKMNVAKVVEEINKKTQPFAGMQVPVKILVDIETKEFTITVGTPPVSSMLKRELKKEKLATVKEDKTRELAGDLPFETVVKIAESKDMPGNMKAKVKQVLGTCVSSGVTVDGKDAKLVIREVDEGKYSI